MKKTYVPLTLPVLLLTILLLAAVPMGATQNQTTGGSATLPSDFPTDIPLYKNAQLFKSGFWMDKPELGKDYWFDTTDPVETVIAFYKSELPVKGWTITKNAFVANPNTISVIKGKQMVMVSPNGPIMKNGSQITRIEIIILPQ